MENLSRKTIIFSIVVVIIILVIAILSKINIKTITLKEEINKLALEEQEKIKIEVDIKEETATAYKCVLTFTANGENNKIKSIEYPEEGQETNTIQISEEGREKVAIDYELQKDDIDKKFKVKTIDDEIIIKRTAYNISLHYNDSKDTIINKKFLLGKQYVLDKPPVEDGYAFLGWSKDKNSKKCDYKDTYKQDNESDVNLYAIYELKEFTVSVNNLTANSFTINLSEKFNIGTGNCSLKYYVNTSTSGSSYQTNNNVTGLGDSEVRYVWAIITDKTGSERKSTNYVKVVMPHTHVDSCYTMAYADYEFKYFGDNTKDTICKARCNSCSYVDANRCRGQINTNYNYSITENGKSGHAILCHRECGATNSIEWYNSNWTTNERKVYYRECVACRNWIDSYFNTDSAFRWACRHDTKEQLICTKSTQGRIIYSNF